CYVLSGFGRRACLPSRACSAEFPLAHLVAFQHTIFHAVSGGDRIHNGRAVDTSAVPLRKSLHAFHDRRPKIMIHFTCTYRSYDTDENIDSGSSFWSNSHFDV